MLRTVEPSEQDWREGSSYVRVFSGREADRSTRSHAFAMVHSRTSVASEMPMTSAASWIVNPPKYRSSTMRS